MNLHKEFTRLQAGTNKLGRSAKGAPFLSLGELLRKASGAEALRLFFTQRATSLARQNRCLARVEVVRLWINSENVENYEDRKTEVR